MEIGNLAEICTALATGAAVWVAIRTIDAKRKDDRRGARLARINQQLSQLYGKLAIINEAGVKNWNSFCYQYSNDNKSLGREFMRFFPYEPKDYEPITRFNPSDPTAAQMVAYRQWLRALFMPTNEEMLEVISANGDLVIGGVMPPVLVMFTEHVASLRMLLLRIDEEEVKNNYVFLDNWREYTKLMSLHPPELSYYIGATFRVLKTEQEKLLSTDEEPCTEQQLATQIERLINEFRVHWMEKEYIARKAAGQDYAFSGN